MRINSRIIVSSGEPNLSLETCIRIICPVQGGPTSPHQIGSTDLEQRCRRPFIVSHKIFWPRKICKLILCRWDEQVTYFTARGWCTLRFDLLGYGQSLPCESYIQGGYTPPVKNHDHAMEVIEEYRRFGGRAAIDEKFIVIGLSRGASTHLHRDI